MIEKPFHYWIQFQAKELSLEPKPEWDFLRLFDYLLWPSTCDPVNLVLNKTLSSSSPCCVNVSRPIHLRTRKIPHAEVELRSSWQPQDTKEPKYPGWPLRCIIHDAYTTTAPAFHFCPCSWVEERCLDGDSLLGAGKVSSGRSSSSDGLWTVDPPYSGSCTRVYVCVWSCLNHGSPRT